MINKEEALILLKDHLKSENLIKHSLSVAIVMKHLAKHLHEDEEKWYITGLLHDIDYDMTFDQPEKHSLIAMDILKDTDISEDVKQAIKAHSGNFEIISLLDKCLWACDPITGLVLASAFMIPERKISLLKQSSLLKKYKSKNFAAGANREQISSCETVGISLTDFLNLATEAMSSIEEQLL